MLNKSAFVGKRILTL